MPWWVEIYPSGYANRRGFLASVRSMKGCEISGRLFLFKPGTNCDRSSIRCPLSCHVPTHAPCPLSSSAACSFHAIADLAENRKGDLSNSCRIHIAVRGTRAMEALAIGRIMSSSHVRLTACETGRAPVIGSQVIRAEVQVTFCIKRDPCLDIWLHTSGIKTYPILLF
jgi:hypothetical protein